MVPLASNQGLGVAIMSYNGRMNFGLVGDYDVLYDIDELGGDLYAALAELAGAAGVELSAPRLRMRRSTRSSPPAQRPTSTDD